MAKYKCQKCNSIDVRVDTAKKVEVELTLRVNKNGNLTDEDAPYGIKIEEGHTFLYCKNCPNFGHPNDRDKFTIIQSK